MKIGDIVEQQQPELHNKLKESKKVKRQESLSFRDFQQLMGHSSYRRGRGGIRQVKYD